MAIGWQGGVLVVGILLGSVSGWNLNVLKFLPNFDVLHKHIKHNKHFAEDPEVHMNTCELVTSKGYPCEEHKVLTPDGYLLGVQRIPYGLNNKNISSRPVAFLQHGLLCSSSNWVVNLANESLGFILADTGYDVWMGNVRGNTYSRSHVKFNPNMPEFWEFSWDEMSKYDLPAMINYALNHTGQKKLYYAAHSQGSLIAFTRFSLDPELAKKVQVFFAMGPVATVKHIKGAFKLMSYFVPEVKLLVELLGIHEFLPKDELIDFLATTVCDFPTRIVCKNFLFLLAGYDPKQLNTTRMPVYLTHTPAGTSVQNMIHWSQMVKSGKCQAYDYGSTSKNRDHYGQPTPPLYPIENMTTPVVLFWGGNDWLADPEDVKTLIPRLKSLIGNNEIKDFDHLDFIWGLDAAPLVYDKIIKIMKERPILD